VFSVNDPLQVPPMQFWSENWHCLLYFSLVRPYSCSLHINKMVLNWNYQSDDRHHTAKLHGLFHWR